MKNKNLVFTFFISSISLFILFFGILFFYDPLRIFHKPWIDKDYLQKDMRQQAAGLINNWEFDSIILGTSMLENTSSNEASKYLGGNFVNISLSGSDFYERKPILSYALKKKNIQTVLYSLDYLSLMNDRKSTISTYEYLYDDNSFNNFKAYINDRYLKCIVSLDNSCMGRKTDFDRPNAWYMKQEHSSRFGNLENWFTAKNNAQIKRAFQSIVDSANKIKKGEIATEDNFEEKILQSEEYLNETILNFVQQYPNTQFILIIPPYSRLHNAIDAQYNKPNFERLKRNITFLIRENSKYKNLKIYGWGDMSFPDDIANYKDLVHYHQNINSLMLQWIQQDQGLLTTKNIDNYLNILTKKSLEYDLISISNKIEAYLKNAP